ncbi:MAG: class I SAM-dependent RNA methyltransferase, partial [Acidobacteriales bacterium]|nr:class I SAM-dependent RNA methyltransferase [Terriglobales bacterium]
LPSGDRAKSVFVPYSLPGERVRANLVEDKKSYARAEVERILEPSAQRATPECKYFGTCGGCQYQHASYEAQLASKRNILIESLHRTAAIELPVQLTVHASPQQYGYRNRTRVHVEHTPTYALGYYKAGSRQLVAIDACPISSPLLNRVIRTLGASRVLPPAVREIEIFADDQDRQVLLELYVGAQRPSDEEFRRFLDFASSELPECFGVHVFAESNLQARIPTLQQTASAGASYLNYRVGNCIYRTSAGSFFQVNRFMVEPLMSLVTDNLSGHRALDLYAGVGLFSLPLADSFDEFVAVEASPFAFTDLDHQLPPRARRYCQTTENFLTHRGEEALACDVAIIDPPRAGIGPLSAKLLTSLLPKEIRYVSCDPVTLARDLKVLLESGYRIREAHLLDMFPQTMHIESFFRLTSSRHE